MKPGTRDRLAHIETEARALARSGKYLTSRSIERALLAEGYQDTPKVFANRWTHYELDRLCEQATYARGQLSWR